ncbi:MAG: dihydropteroate synthase [Acidobacteriota bacterium]
MREIFSIKFKSRQLILGKETKIMGILNVTPDSFSNGGDYFSTEKAIEKGTQMEEEGAEIIDIGGESTRPGSEPTPLEEERKRVIPVLKELRKKVNCFISVDTYKARIAEEAFDWGADMINDISGLRFDKEMIKIIKKESCPFVIMHMKGTPKTMQDNPVYENLFEEIENFFYERINFLSLNEIDLNKVIIDPGIGFGKSYENNLRIIKNLNFLEKFKRPVLIGVSRKSFIGKILNLPPKERVEGSIAASIISVINGAHILRSHDVKSIKRAIKTAEEILYS